MHLKVGLKDKRTFSYDELIIINKLLSIEFEGKNILLSQIQYSIVVAYCPCGCKTVDVEVDKRKTQKFNSEIRVPVEMIMYGLDVPIIAKLHLKEGYICELEIFRADSMPIVDFNLEVTTAEIFIND